MKLNQTLRDVSNDARGWLNTWAKDFTEVEAGTTTGGQAPNPLLWQLGHLACVEDDVCWLFGAPDRLTSEALRKACSTGCAAPTSATRFPALAELWALLGRTHTPAARPGRPGRGRRPRPGLRGKPTRSSSRWARRPTRRRCTSFITSGRSGRCARRWVSPVSGESPGTGRVPGGVRGNMRLLALSVGGPREVEWQGRTVRTSIFKQPVAGRVRVTRLNVEGDEQSDLSVHGGPDKAVYAYPAEHYAAWRGSCRTRTLRGAPSGRT